MANIVAGEDETDGADDLDNDNQNGEYKCSCSADWTGPDCSFRFERNCADNLDNDNGKWLSSFIIFDFSPSIYLPFERLFTNGILLASFSSFSLSSQTLQMA